MSQEIDFNQPVLNINGEPFKNGEEVLRLGEICANALLGTFQGDKADGVQKLKRFNLAVKIKGSNEEEAFPSLVLNSSQKKMIEEMVEKLYITTIYARVYQALEGTTEDG